MMGQEEADLTEEQSPLREEVGPQTSTLEAAVSFMFTANDKIVLFSIKTRPRWFPSVYYCNDHDEGPITLPK